jgi:HD-GYP domain-containing protein (c-di-GMP phosphodiesterase class II)
MGRAWDVGEGKRRSAAGVWPYVAATTSLVLVLPVGVVWLLRAMGVIRSGWVAAALGVCLSLLAAFAASAAWTRWRAAGDVPFGDLLLWGWVRRIRAERKLTSAAAVLSASDAEDSGAQDRVLHQVAAALDAQDPYLDGHSKRVARYAAITAKRMGLPAEEVARVRAAATIHDVGKLRVPDEVIRKPAELTDAEFEEVKRHAVHGADIVAGLRDPELTSIVRHHHERFDGGGYPDGLRGVGIPLGARIVAVADTFDALTSPRPYRPAASHKRALDVLVEEAGSQLDPAVVRAFLDYYRSSRGVALWGLLAAPFGRPRELVPLLVAVPLIAVTAAADFTTIAGRDRVTSAGLAARPAGLSPPRPTVRTSRAQDPGRRLARENPMPYNSARAVEHASASTSSTTEATATTPPAAPLTRPAALTPEQGAPQTSSRVPQRPRPDSTPGQRRRRAPPATPPPGSPVTTPVPGPAPEPPPPTPPGTPPPPLAPVVTAVPAPPARPRTAPTTKDACKHDGHVQFGFPNQGSCVAAVNKPQP